MILPADFTPDFPGLVEALSTTEPSVAIRLNPAKTNPDEVGGDRPHWCPTGRYLESRPDFTFDPSMHMGRYYVQDPSSMIYYHIARYLSSLYDRPVVALDACAAPGGKATAIIDALTDGSLVVANEYVGERAEILHENIVKWGYPNVVVSRGDTSRYRQLVGMFDIIAADVPCSGEGMFRKDAAAVAQWSPRLVADCARLQREIVENLWEALAPGGYLIYSTCTFNRMENEDNVGYFVDTLPGATLLEIPVGDDWQLTRRDGCLHFLPGDIRGEGLTVALLQKSADTATKSARKPGKHKRGPASVGQRLPATVKEWIGRDGYTLRVDGDRVCATPDCWQQQLDALAGALSLPWGLGVEVATLKGKDAIPAHALALSNILDRGAFPMVEVDNATAIAYLRRESLSLPADVARGFVLLTYGGYPLGFVKNIGSRANNLYLQPWRILSTYIPDNQPSII